MSKRCSYKILAILLALTVGLSFTWDYSLAKAKKVKLSAKKITLNVQKSKTLSIKGTSKKVKWTVAGKKLVNIKAKGKKRHKVVIKAKKKAGTCYVKAKVGGKTYKCKVIVKAPKVSKDPFVNAFCKTSFGLLRRVQKSDGTSNILISPDSILQAMVMTANGTAGNTRAEIQKAFGNYPIDSYNEKLSALSARLVGDEYVSYNSANSIWVNKELAVPNKGFLDTAGQYYDAEVQTTEFDQAAVDRINDWVSQKTREMIPGIVESLDPSTLIMLINAIAFEGKWQKQYNETVNRDFTMADGTRKKVSMLEGTENTYLTVKGGTGFVKPYEGGQIAFLGLLPPKGVSVDKYANSITGMDFINGYLNRKTKNIEVETRMPEFEYDYEILLNAALSNMGIRDVFEGGKADFSPMFDEQLVKGQPYIDEVLHKTHIELDKNGTKAAAVTAVRVISKSAKPKNITVKKVYLDRPFVYAIIDTRTGVPLFLGVVNQP